MNDKLYSYFSDYCQEHAFPEETFRKQFPFLFDKDAPRFLSQLFALLLSAPKEILENGLFLYRETLHPTAFFGEIKNLSLRYGQDLSAVCLPLFLLLSFFTKELHKKAKIPSEISKDTLAELALWGKKHKQLTGQWGLSDWYWCAKYLGGELFRIGSLEYQLCKDPLREENALSNDEWILKIHVPAGCDFSREARWASYRAALSFFAPRLGVSSFSFLCESWLLARDHAALFPSNIADFRNDFTVLKDSSDREGGFLWRIFGSSDVRNPTELPHHNRLQTLYRDKLLKKEPYYSAIGYFTLSL